MKSIQNSTFFLLWGITSEQLKVITQ